MKVYYAHPLTEYHTTHEKECEDKIHRIFPGCTIVNPNIITEEKIQEVASEYPTIDPFVVEMTFLYYPLIAKCNTLVYTLDSCGHISNGVRYEIAYAKRIGRNAIQLPNIEV